MSDMTIVFEFKHKNGRRTSLELGIDPTSFNDPEKRAAFISRGQVSLAPPQTRFVNWRVKPAA